MPSTERSHALMGYEIFLFLALMIGVMWFTTNRGKKKMADQRERMSQAMVPGTSVMTIGGFFGRVVDVDGDVVTLESPSGVETIWLKGAIKEIKEPPFAPAEDDGDHLVVPDDASSLTAVPPAEATTTEVEDRPVVDPVDDPERSDDQGRRPGPEPRA